MKQLNAGKAGQSIYKGYPMNALWHTDSKSLYWCGNWYHRTPLELLKECQATIVDLIQNHPELINDS